MSDLPVEMPKTWHRLTDKGREAISVSVAMARTKHGLYAQVPVVCKGDKCPYNKTCTPMAYGITPEGEPCAMEIAMIAELTNRYAAELGLDTNKIANLTLIKDVVDAEIMIMRCQALIANDGNIIQNVAVSVTPKGQTVYRPEPHVALAIMDRARTQKQNALRLLNSTPKDKAKEAAMDLDPSSYAARLLAQYMKEKKEKTIETYLDTNPSDGGVPRYVPTMRQEDEVGD